MYVNVYNIPSMMRITKTMMITTITVMVSPATTTSKSSLIWSGSES